MSELTRDQVKLFLQNYLDRRLEARGAGRCSALPDDCDLLLSGLIDSLGLLELVTATEEFCGCEIDFETLDPDAMTVVGPLCTFILQQARVALERNQGYGNNGPGPVH